MGIGLIANCVGSEVVYSVAPSGSSGLSEDGDCPTRLVGSRWYSYLVNGGLELGKGGAS